MSDLIRREDAVEAIYEALRTPLPNYNNDFFHDSMSLAITMAKNIPSAEPERKKGEWIKEDLSGYLTPGGNSIYHCSECGHREGPYPYPRLTDFCPSCGARLERR